MFEDDFRAYAWQEMAKYAQEKWGGMTAKNINITFTYSASIPGGSGTHIQNVPLTLTEGKSLYEAIIDEMNGSAGMDLEKDSDVLEDSQCAMPGVSA